MGYHNLPPAAYAAELNALEKLLRALPINGAIEALDLLETLTCNVIQNPTGDKYRRIRTSNAKLAPLFGLSGITDVMAEMGWSQEGEFMVLPKEVKLEFHVHIVKILEAKSYFGKERENAKRSAKLGADPSKASMLKQLELDRRERAAEGGIPIPTAREADTASVAAVAASTPVSAAAAATCKAEAPEEVPKPVSRTAAPETKATPVTTKPKSAFDFENRTKAEEVKVQAEMSLQELRELQKAKYKEFEADPNARNSEVYQRPPCVANGSAEEPGWFDWMWGGSSSSSGGGGSRGGGRDDKPKGPRMKTIKDLPPPVRRGGG